MGTYVGNNDHNNFSAYKEGIIFKTWEKWYIAGNGGNDVLYGGEKYDNIYGGTGDDTLAGYGDDDYLSGDVGNDIIYGGSGNDGLYGGEGNDYLYGMDGSDVMYGGLGNDVYEINSLADGIYEGLNEGVDTVFSFVGGYTLTANVENLYLYDNGSVEAIGNELGNVISGNSAANRLYGQAGNDALYGGLGNDVLWGDTGSDSAYGGMGNDMYDIKDVGDQIFEGLNEGTDTVYAYISHTLNANVENVYLVETIAAAVNATGNALNNVVYGNSNRNTLSGQAGDDFLSGMAENDILLGGAGEDTLSGGTGNDSLNGYGGSAGEKDKMTGELGADSFLFGSAASVFYTGEGFGSVTDFSTQQGDKIVLKGRQQQYELRQEAFRGAGGAAQDTLIYRGDDLIAVIEDTRLSFSANQASFNFV